MDQYQREYEEARDRYYQEQHDPESCKYLFYIGIIFCILFILSIIYLIFNYYAK